MATYRNIRISFWTDTKVVDDFTPEDKYFYLYLFTNPHTNLAGCYEVSIGTMATELGYSKDTVERLLKRFVEVHKVIDYSTENKEILIINWHKYNWTTSDKFVKPLKKQIEEIKTEEFKKYLSELLLLDTVSIPYLYRSDTTKDIYISNSNEISKDINNDFSKNINISISNTEKMTYVNTFEDLWKEYPRKKEKSKAYKCYQARLKDGFSEEELLTAVKNYAEECKKEHREEKYIKLCATFLGPNTPFVDYLKRGNNDDRGKAERDQEAWEREHAKQIDAVTKTLFNV